MNIPSPAITTASVTPQDPRAKTTTTVTLPEESSNLVAPLIAFRKTNNLDSKDRKKNENGTVGTCMALADLVSEIFELVNDTAFAGIIEGRPDKESGNADFLGFIGAVNIRESWRDESERTSSIRNELLTIRELPKNKPLVPKKARNDPPSSEDNESKTASDTSHKPISSHSSVSNRVKKYFGESPLARRRREKNSVLEAVRRAERPEPEYLIDPSIYSIDDETTANTFGASLETTTTGDEIDGQTVDTLETSTMDADDERTANSTGGDDALRDDVDEERDQEQHDHRQDAFPPVIQKFHSLNPMKPAMISKYNKQWPPLQFPSEANHFEAFNEELKNHHASSGHQREDQTIKSYRDEPPQEESPVEEDEDIVSTKPEQASSPVTREKMNIPPPSPEKWTRRVVGPEDMEEHLISTSTIKKKKAPGGNIEIGDSHSTSSSRSSSRTIKRSFWRPTVLQQLRKSGSSSSSAREDTAPIPLTPDRMSQVEENKKRVQRNFQWRIKHHQAMLVRQKLAKRNIPPTTNAAVSAAPEVVDLVTAN